MGMVTKKHLKNENNDRGGLANLFFLLVYIYEFI